VAGGDFSYGPAEFLTSENPPAGDFRYAAGDNRAGETLLHDTGTRKVNHSGFNEARDDRVTVASAG